MAITTKDVADLRARTGVGMMDCKKALEAAGGDAEKAIEFLREKGLAAAAKKSGRIAAEGMAYAEVCTQCGRGVVLEVNCETDFAAKSEPFKDFVTLIANTILKNKPADLQSLSEVEIDGKTVDAITKEKVYTIGENIGVRRFDLMEGVLVSYVHGGGRIGVLVSFDVDASAKDNEKFKEAAKDVAMHIAAVNPMFLNADCVDADTLNKEKEIAKATALNEGKPENVVEKIVDGRIKKYLKEVCLVEQPFVKDGDISVSQYLANVSKEIGATVSIKDYKRYERGEGIEKKEDNFADEVAGMIK